MKPPVPQLLLASPAVASFVGSNPVRIFEDVAPQSTQRPYITWMIVYGMPENYVAEAPTMWNFRVQVECWADTSAEAYALADAVRDALQPHGYELGVNPNLRDPETGNRSYSFDWSFWTEREAASSS